MEILPPSPSPANETSGSTSTSDLDALDQVTREIAAESPEIAAPTSASDAAGGAGSSPAPPPPAGQVVEPPVTKETLKEAMLGAIAGYGLLQQLIGFGGPPEEIVEQMIPAARLDSFCAKLARLACKYDLSEAEWLAFWNRWKDEILFLGIEVPALTFHAVKVYRAWSAEDAKRKASSRPVDVEAKQDQADEDLNSSAAADETET